MLDRLKALWTTEPVRVVSALVALVVFAAAKAGVVLDARAVEEALALALPVVLGGELARARVTPTAATFDGPGSDDLLPHEAVRRIARTLPGP